MDETSNPAERLHSVLDCLFAHWSRSSGQVGPVALGAVWLAEYDAVDEYPRDDPSGPEFFEWLSSLLELADEVVRLAQSERYRTPSFAEDHVVGIARGLRSAQFHRENLGSNTTWLNAVALNSLNAVADRLADATDVVERRVPDEALERMRTLTYQLTLEVRQSDLPTSLRVFLIEHLARMERAIDLYWVGGIRHMRSALDESIGHLTNSPDVSDAADTSNSEVASRVWKATKTASWLVTFAAGVVTVVPGLALPWSDAEVHNEITVLVQSEQRELGPAPTPELEPGP